MFYKRKNGEKSWFKNSYQEVAVYRAKAYFLLRKIKSNSLILSCLIKLFFVYCIDYQIIKQYEKR